MDLPVSKKLIDEVPGGVWEESDHSAFPVHHSLQIVET